MTARATVAIGRDSLVDLETMKRADYLVGSMISNFFTLATELSFYHHNDMRKRYRVIYPAYSNIDYAGHAV